MRYVFGPVPSRRLGRSLGVDPVPLKTCDWNCVYCQLGRSRPVTVERKAWVPTDAVLAELREALSGPRDDVDWVTFVGSGEPTLHVDLGRMVSEAKRLSDKPVAVITNGAQLWRPEVRRELLLADAVMPTLAAGDAALHRALHRPHPECTFERHVAGLRAFREEYAGELWLEVMLVSGLNDGDDALESLAAALVALRPDEVQIMLPTRPPCEQWVRPPAPERLMKAIAVLGEVAAIIPPAPSDVALAPADPAAAILDVVQRHPMREAELTRLFAGTAAETIHQLLTELEANGRAHRISRHGFDFWVETGTTFGETDHTRPRPERLGRRGHHEG